MGFNYLDDKNWEEITREERFFCQRLYELVRADSVADFAKYVSEELRLNLKLGGDWELGYEVCFYRDLWQSRGRAGKLHSPKRTFDLCLFGQSAMVIIEAKAAGGFDAAQNESFNNDQEWVHEVVNVDKVYLVGLCSSSHKQKLDPSSEKIFGGRLLEWSKLAERYGHDTVLQRADDIYEPTNTFFTFGRNSNVKLSGTALLEAFHGGAAWWVGRGGGGATGDRFLEDVQSGRWRTQIYEVNTNGDCPPSPNYFGLEEFARSVERLEKGR
jgi:hypothetical protein